MLCSECGFDFMSPEASFDNLFNQTCPNEHVIGEDGAFIRLIGLDRWLELSLVSIGASSKPKILGRTKHRLGEEAFSQIAADGGIPEAVVLYAQMKGFNMPGDKKSGDTTVDLSPITEALAAATATLATLTESMTALQADMAELKAAVPASADAEEAATAAAEVQASLEVANEQVSTLEASETELKAQVTSLEASAALKAGGVSNPAISDATASNSNPAGRLAAFKTSK